MDPPVVNGHNSHICCVGHCFDGDRLSILRQNHGANGVRFMLYNMHHTATRILPEDFWERNQPEGTHPRLASSRHIFKLSHHWDNLGTFATGINYCEIESLIHQQLLFCAQLLIIANNNGKIIPCFARI